MIGEIAVDDLLRSINPGLSVTLMVIFSLLATIMMLNVLIALLNDVYQRVSLNVEDEWYMERCRIIMEIENTLGSKGANERWFPKWLHVLEPHIDAFAKSSSKDFAAAELSTTVQDIRLSNTKLVERADRTESKLDQLLAAQKK